MTDGLDVASLAEGMAAISAAAPRATEATKRLEAVLTEARFDEFAVALRAGRRRRKEPR